MQLPDAAHGHAGSGGASWQGQALPLVGRVSMDLTAFDAAREDVEVIGLAYEEILPDDMRAFLLKHPAGYPIAILDPYNPPADFDTPRGLPLTYLIAPDGKVAKQFLGPVTGREIEAAIAASGGPKAGA